MAMFCQVNVKNYKARDLQGVLNKHKPGDRILLHSHLAEVEQAKGRVRILETYNPAPKVAWVKVKATGDIRLESKIRIPQLVASGIVQKMDTDADGRPVERKRGPGRPKKDD